MYRPPEWMVISLEKHLQTGVFGQSLWFLWMDGWVSSYIQTQIIEQLKSFCERVIKKRQANTNFAQLCASSHGVKFYFLPAAQWDV